MKKLLYLFSAVLLIFAIGCATTTVEIPEKAEAVEAVAVEAPIHYLVVLHTNDHHGHPVAFYNYPAQDVGGLPARATLVKSIRAENQNVIVLDAGDLNTGRPESNFFKAEPDIVGYNKVGYDALAFGNHEFDNTMEITQKQISMSEFPWLCANVKKENGKYMDNVKPYIIKEYEGFKVAVFGLVTKRTEIVGNPENIKGLIFEDEVEASKVLVPKLKKEADVVIALVHMGIYDSTDRGSERLAAQVPGIDLIVDGHTHTKLDAPVMVKNVESGMDVPIIQAWCWGLVLGRMDLWIKNKKIIDYKFESIPVNLKTREKKADGTSVYHFIGSEIAIDAGLKETLQVYVDKVDAILNEKIGYAEDTFFNTDVRKQETALGDMVSDSMLWYSNNMGLEVDFAIQNGGGIRTDLPEGDIRKKLIYEILPFDNSIMVMTLKGSDVQALFDFIATIKRGAGAFPQVSEGVSYTINYTTGKVENILIGGKPIDPGRTYRIATNSYMAAGGDGYKIFHSAIEKYDSSVFQRDAFIDYIIEIGGSIKPEVQERIEIIGGEEAGLPLLKKAS